jgi:hypothetical protein
MSNLAEPVVSAGSDDPLVTQAAVELWPSHVFEGGGDASEIGQIEEP